jgi:hypothetical protein
MTKWEEQGHKTRETVLGSSLGEGIFYTLETNSLHSGEDFFSVGLYWKLIAIVEDKYKRWYSNSFNIKIFLFEEEITHQNYAMGQDFKLNLSDHSSYKRGERKNCTLRWTNTFCLSIWV